MVDIMTHSEAITNLENEMIPVKQVMEKRGLNVDIYSLEGLIQKVRGEKDSLTLELKQLFGINDDINFNSSKDVSDILFKSLGIIPKVTRSGRLSTNRRILRDINNPITDKIVHYRELEKLLSSLNAIHEAVDKDENKLFCSYVDTCPSGRLYTKNYSFQGIPEAARSVIYADPGSSFVLFDYSMFELRILSALAHDTYFKNCWVEGLDLHCKVVADMIGISYASVSDKERKLGKILNFGLAYGQEAGGLARNLHISIEQAQKLMDVYKGKIPEIEAFKLEAIDKARLIGYAETYYGRRRFLPDITSHNVSERKKSERRVINHIVQGCASDIMKFSLVKLHNEGFIISTMVHDSILLTVPDEKLDQSLFRVREIMETEIEGMKFPVSCKVGKRWNECY